MFPLYVGEDRTKKIKLKQNVHVAFRSSESESESVFFEENEATTDEEDDNPQTEEDELG